MVDVRLQLRREAPLRRLMNLTRIEVISSPNFEQRYMFHSAVLKRLQNNLSLAALETNSFRANVLRKVRTQASTVFPHSLNSSTQRQFVHALNLSMVFPAPRSAYTHLLRFRTLPQPCSKPEITISSTKTMTLADSTILNTGNCIDPVLIWSRNLCGKC